MWQEPNNIENNPEVVIEQNTNSEKIEEVKEQTKLDALFLIELNQIKNIKLKKEADWSISTYLDIKSLEENSNVNEILIHLIDSTISRWYYLDWLFNVWINLWNRKIRLLEWIHRLKITKKFFNWDYVKIWTIKKQKEDRFLPKIEKNGQFNKAKFEFRFWDKYNIDDVIANLRNGWWFEAKSVKVWIFYSILKENVEFCNAIEPIYNDKSPEAETERENIKKNYLLNIFKIYKSLYPTSLDATYPESQLESALIRAWFFNKMWRNFSTLIAEDIKPKNWLNSQLKVISPHVRLNQSPKDKDWTIINLYVYENTSFNVKTWETLFEIIPATSWTHWYALNWEIIKQTPWVDNITAKRISWANIETIVKENRIFLVSTINGYVDWYKDNHDKITKINVNKVWKNKSWVDMTTWDTEETTESIKTLNWDINWRCYTLNAYGVIVKWWIIDKAKVFFNDISIENKVFEWKISWNIIDSKIHIKWPAKIQCNNISHWSSIFAPEAEIEANNIEWWVIIVCKKLTCKNMTNIKAVFAEEIIIENKYTSWSSPSFLIWQNITQNQIDSKKWDLQLIYNWRKLKQKNIKKLEDDIQRATKKIDELSKNENILTYKKYLLLDELKSLEKVKFDLFNKDENSRTRELIDEIKNLRTKIKKLDEELKHSTPFESIKMITNSFRELIEQLQTSILQTKHEIEIAWKELIKSKSMHIKNSITEPWTHINIWALNPDLISQLYREYSIISKAHQIEWISEKMDKNFDILFASITRNINKNYNHITTINSWSFEHKLN